MLLVALVGCHRSSSPPVHSNRAEPTDVTLDAAEVTACERYRSLLDQASACTQLSDEIRQSITQRGIDMEASVSESGMDDSTPVDPEALCEDEVAYLVRVGSPCGLE